MAAAPKLGANAAYVRPSLPSASFTSPAGLLGPLPHRTVPVCEREPCESSRRLPRRLGAERGAVEVGKTVSALHAHAQTSNVCCGSGTWTASFGSSRFNVSVNVAAWGASV